MSEMVQQMRVEKEQRGETATQKFNDMLNSVTGPVSANPNFNITMNDSNFSKDSMPQEKRSAMEHHNSFINPHQGSPTRDEHAQRFASRPRDS